MIDLLQRVPLFMYLDEDQLNHIYSICSRKSYQAGSVLFKEKEEGSDFFVILSGSVKIYTTHQGEEKVLTVFAAGDSFGELSLIDGKPRSASAQVIEDSVLFNIPGDKFLNLLKNDFEITRNIMRELCDRLRNTNQHVHDLTFLDSRTRVIKSLITMANKGGIRSGTTITFRVALNFDELSYLAGVTKDVLMQVIRDLEARGILTISTNQFMIDLAKLRN